MSSSQRERREEQGPIISLHPLFLVENLLKSPSFSSDWGTYSEGGIFTGSMIQSFPSSKTKFSIRERQGGQLKGKWPNITICGEKWLLEKRI